MSSSAQASLGQVDERPARDKLAALHRLLGSMDSALVAFSGGADSAFLAFMGWQWEYGSHSEDTLIPRRPIEYWARQCFTGASIMTHHEVAHRGRVALGRRHPDRLLHVDDARDVVDVAEPVDDAHDREPRVARLGGRGEQGDAGPRHKAG